MKKQKFNGKLRLKKNIISGFNASSIRGGHTTGSQLYCTHSGCTLETACACDPTISQCSQHCSFQCDPVSETLSPQCFTENVSCDCR